MATWTLTASSMLYSSKIFEKLSKVTMFSRLRKQELKIGNFLSIGLKCGASLLLLALSSLIVSCGNNNNAAAVNLGGPVVTVTIQIGNDQNVSPTPTLPPYWCGAWATQTSPAYNMTTNVGVYAKFTRNNNGNPEGVGGASATATVLWPDNSTTNQTVTTTADGLAVFSISTANKASAINKITLVNVTFQKEGIPPCTVEGNQAAFFTLTVVTPAASPTQKVPSTQTATGTPIFGTPLPGPTKTPIGVGKTPIPSGTPPVLPGG